MPPTSESAPREGARLGAPGVGAGEIDARNDGETSAPLREWEGRKRKRLAHTPWRVGMWRILHVWVGGEMDMRGDGESQVALGGEIER